MLEAPNEGDWGLYVQEEYFDLIKDAGFDFVRLPVRWSGHADKSSPYALDSVFFSRVDQVVGWALARNLPIIIDFHNYREISETPGGERDRFLAFGNSLRSTIKVSRLR
jgi:endoglucanase